MKKLKLIRIDETPQRSLGGPIKIVMDNFPPKFGSWDRGEMEPKPPFFSGSIFPKSIFPENNSANFDLPPFLLEQIMRTNNLIIEFNADLERKGIPQPRIDEYQHDSFKIGLRITEGILLHTTQPWLASRQFDLAAIHVENTLITLDNLEEDYPLLFSKISLLRENCRKLAATIQEFKEYFDLDHL